MTGASVLLKEQAGANGTKGTFTPKDFPEVSAEISRQKQLRYLEGTPQLAERGKGGYLSNAADAQKVLDAYRFGNAVILGKNAQGFPVVRVDGISGTECKYWRGDKQPADKFFLNQRNEKPKHCFYKPESQIGGMI